MRSEAIDVPLALVGNALAVQVAATERAQRGLHTLVVNPGGPWGGYFAGVEGGGQRWDAGMVLYEFTSFRESAQVPALAGYDPLRRNDIGRFCSTVRAYVAQHQPTRDIAMPQMWTGGRLLPDMLLANGLEALPQLACADAARAQLRGPDVPASHDPWHASRKADWPPDDSPDFEHVSRLNHGAALHEALITPFARKVLGNNEVALAPAFHRVPWLPLYWPETLRSWLNGKPQALASTAFSHPGGETIADLCSRLMRQMRAAEAIDVRAEKVMHVERLRHGYALHLERSGRVTTARLGWAQAPGQGLAVCGLACDRDAASRLSLALAFLRVPSAALASDFSFIHAVDRDVRIYRVGNASHYAGDEGPSVRLVAEANAASLAHLDDEAALREVMLDLERMGLVREGTAPEFSMLRRLPGALPLPTPQALAQHRHERERLLAALPGIELLAASAGPFATSLSDQIVQGLRLAMQETRADAPCELATLAH